MAKTPASRVKKEDVTVKDPRVEAEEQDGVEDGMGWDISRSTASTLPADELEAATSSLQRRKEMVWRHMPTQEHLKF